ncbi:hypothetical protein [Paraburkholderia sp. 2C]
MEFPEVFEDQPYPTVSERIGVMSVDSLIRQWEPVAAESGYLVAKSKDGKSALLGRMCVREDGKFGIEVAVRAHIENGTLRKHELWHVDATAESHRIQRFNDVMQHELSKSEPKG